MPLKKRAGKKKANTNQDNEFEQDGPRGEYRKRKSCPDCNSINIEYDNNLEQVVCRDCGSLFEEFAQMQSRSLEDGGYL